MNEVVENRGGFPLNPVLIDIHTGRLSRVVLRRDVHPHFPPGTWENPGLLKGEFQDFALWDARLLDGSGIGGVVFGGALGVKRGRIAQQ